MQLKYILIENKFSKRKVSLKNASESVEEFLQQTIQDPKLSQTMALSLDLTFTW